MTRASPTSSRSSPTSTIAIVDPKDFASNSFVDRKTDVCIIPPNSFALARTVEYFRVPRDVLVICLGKSTYARCGIIVNVTPLEPGWEGHVTLEFSNTTPLPAKVYANEGACQFLFLQGQRALRDQLRRPRRQIYGPAGRDPAQAVTLDEAQALDAADPLAFARERFRASRRHHLSRRQFSSAPCPPRRRRACRNGRTANGATTSSRAGTSMAGSTGPTQIAARLAPIVGAKPNELLVANSTSRLPVQAGGGRCALRPETQRSSSPRSAISRPTSMSPQGSRHAPAEAAALVPRERVAWRDRRHGGAVTLTHVDYRSGERHDMAAINAAAHAMPARSRLWDLSHSAGAIELDLDGTALRSRGRVRLQISERRTRRAGLPVRPPRPSGPVRQPPSRMVRPRISFRLQQRLSPGEGISRFQTGTPPILALAALEKA